MMNQNKYLPKELQKHIKEFLIDDVGKHKIKFNKVMNDIKYLKYRYEDAVNSGRLFLSLNDPDARDWWYCYGDGCPPLRYSEWVNEIIDRTLLYKEGCEYSHLIHNFILIEDYTACYKLVVDLLN